MPPCPAWDLSSAEPLQVWGTLCKGGSSQEPDCPPALPVLRWPSRWALPCWGLCGLSHWAQHPLTSCRRGCRTSRGGGGCEISLSPGPRRVHLHLGTVFAQISRSRQWKGESVFVPSDGGNQGPTVSCASGVGSPWRCRMSELHRTGSCGNEPGDDQGPETLCRSDQQLPIDDLCVCRGLVGNSPRPSLPSLHLATERGVRWRPTPLGSSGNGGTGQAAQGTRRPRSITAHPQQRQGPAVSVGPHVQTLSPGAVFPG